MELNSLSSDTQPAQNQPADPHIAPSSHDDSLLFADSFKALGKAWLQSTVFKVLSLFIIAIIILFIVFIFLTVGYGAANAICDSDLESQKNEHSACQESVQELNRKRDSIQANIKTEDENIKKLNDEVKGLNDKIRELNETIGTQNSTLTKRKEDNQNLLEEEKNEKNNINRLTEQKTQKQAEIKKLQEELKNLTIDLEAKRKTKQYLIYGGIAGITIDVTALSFVGYCRSQLNVMQKDVDDMELRNIKLRGTLENMRRNITHLNQSIERIKQQIIETDKHIETCKSKILTDKETLNTCVNDEKTLNEAAKALIPLGVNQAVAHLLSTRINYTVDPVLLYNSTEVGFHPEDFHKEVKDFRPMLLVVQTSNGFTFGLYTNVSYERNGKEYKEDPEAFTFSTIRRVVCPIKKGRKAIIFDKKHMLRIGEDEIVIEVSDSTNTNGVAEAGKTFNCGDVDSHKFYAENGHFTITEVLAYYLKLLPLELT